MKPGSALSINKQTEAHAVDICKKLALLPFEMVYICDQVAKFFHVADKDSHGDDILHPRHYTQARGSCHEKNGDEASMHRTASP